MDGRAQASGFCDGRGSTSLWIHQTLLFDDVFHFGDGEDVPRQASFECIVEIGGTFFFFAPFHSIIVEVRGCHGRCWGSAIHVHQFMSVMGGGKKNSNCLNFHGPCVIRLTQM